MNNYIRNKVLILFLVTTLLLVVVPPRPVSAVTTSSENFTLQIHLPEGARIDYLRFYYFDSESAYSQWAWIVAYDGQNADDWIYVASDSASGYDYVVSDYWGEIVDNYNYTYTLQWRPNVIGDTMRLCGMRIAYRLDLGGSWSSFQYKFYPGAAFLPKNGDVAWDYGGAGSIFMDIGFVEYLPYFHKD